MSSEKFLKPLNLGQYVDAFDDEGYDDPTLLDDMTLDMLVNEMKMKSGHARKLMNYLKREGIVKTGAKAAAPGKKSSASFLTSIKMERYVDLFDDEGYDEIENLEGVTAEMLVKDIEGMKRGHAKKIERHVSKILSERNVEEEDDEPNKMSSDRPPPSIPVPMLHTNQTTMASGFLAGVGAAPVLSQALVAMQRHMNENKSLKWHAFMSHMQAEGGDAVMAIDMHLSPRGWILWTDQSPNADVTLQGMKDGVRDSAIYVLYCTTSVFKRPFVRLELLEAVKLKKPILMIYEEDGRRAKFGFNAEDGVPKGFQKITKELLRNHCAIPWERRPHLRKATIELIESRILATVTGKGVGCKPLTNITAEDIAMAEKCVDGDEPEVKKRRPSVEAKKIPTAKAKTASAGGKLVINEKNSWNGTDGTIREPTRNLNVAAMMVTAVSTKGTRAKWQAAMSGVYTATDEVVNGKMLYYHVQGRRFLYYTSTYKNWLCTTNRDQFSKGSGYLRTSTKNGVTPADGSGSMELYDNTCWAAAGCKVISLSATALKAELEKLSKAKVLGVEIRGIVGKGSRASNQNALNRKYFADEKSWCGGRYNVYISADSSHFLFYNNKYENWVVTNKTDAFAQGMGFARCNSIHDLHPGNLTWEIYDTAWTVATGASSIVLSDSECRAALQKRASDRARVKAVPKITIKGFGAKYDGVYTQDAELTLDGRPVYSKNESEFIYYTTIYNNWLVTNSRANFAKGAGLFRTSGKTFDTLLSSGLSWECYDYDKKAWVARAGTSVAYG